MATYAVSPKQGWLSKYFFFASLNIPIQMGLPNFTISDKTKSWFHDIQTGLELLKLVPIYANTQVVGAHSKSQWNKLVHEKLLEFDKNQLFQNMPRTDSGKFYSNIKTQYGRLRTINA
jgi:hypothetical protein